MTVEKNMVDRFLTQFAEYTPPKSLKAPSLPIVPGWGLIFQDTPHKEASLGRAIELPQILPPTSPIPQKSPNTQL